MKNSTFVVKCFGDAVIFGAIGFGKKFGLLDFDITKLRIDHTLRSEYCTPELQCIDNILSSTSSNVGGCYFQTKIPSYQNNLFFSIFPFLSHKPDQFCFYNFSCSKPEVVAFGFPKSFIISNKWNVSKSTAFLNFLPTDSMSSIESTFIMIFNVDFLSG